MSNIQIQLNNEFLRSIVWMENFQLNLKNLEIELLCMENNNEVFYTISLDGVVAFQYRNDEASDDFNIIDVFLEKFNDCKYLEFMKSEVFKEHWVLRFHTGTHHMVVGFRKIVINKNSK